MNLYLKVHACTSLGHFITPARAVPKDTIKCHNSLMNDKLLNTEYWTFE